jgi:hypothetical protein
MTARLSGPMRVSVASTTAGAAAAQAAWARSEPPLAVCEAARRYKAVRLAASAS